MSLTVEVLRKEAAKCQRKTLLKYKIALEKSSGLEELLHGVCLVLFPKPSDYDARRDLIRIFNEIVKEIYGCSRDIPCVVEFGSFTMDLFAAKSDLDLSVNFSNLDIPRDRKISTLKKLAKKFNLLQRSGHVHGVNPITRAIVPVLKVVDSGTGVECDISVGNKDGILKSKILYFVSLIDERFRKLCFLMKAWAQAHNINSARDKTLNSLSIILLVAFHLQTRNHPILPPFSAILRDGCDTGAVAKSIHKFVNYGQNNTESVAELFLTLLLMVLLYIPSVFNLTSLVTPIVYHPSHPHDQLQRTFRPPNLPTPSVYPTFPPIANQMFPSHAGETLRVANLPSASSDLLAYPLAGSKLF